MFHFSTLKKAVLLLFGTALLISLPLSKARAQYNGYYDYHHRDNFGRSLARGLGYGIGAGIGIGLINRVLNPPVYSNPPVVVYSPPPAVAYGTTTTIVTSTITIDGHSSAPLPPPLPPPAMVPPSYPYPIPGYTNYVPGYGYTVTPTPYLP